MAKLYIVTKSSFVMAASFDPTVVDAATSDALRFADASDHEWREDWAGRLELFYKPKRSGRWNSAKVHLTTLDVEPPKTPRYEVRELPTGGYTVWDTRANRAAAGTVLDDREQAQSYANVRNESADG